MHKEDLYIIYKKEERREKIFRYLDLIYNFYMTDLDLRIYMTEPTNYDPVIL